MFSLTVNSNIRRIYATSRSRSTQVFASRTSFIFAYPYANKFKWRRFLVRGAPQVLVSLKDCCETIVRDKCVSLGTIITFFGAESGVPESGTCTVRCYDACRRFHPRRPGSICLVAARFFCIQHAPLTNAFGF